MSILSGLYSWGNKMRGWRASALPLTPRDDCAAVAGMRELDAQLMLQLCRAVGLSERSALALIEQVGGLREVSARLIRYLDQARIQSEAMQKGTETNSRIIGELDAFVQTLPKQIAQERGLFQQLLLEVKVYAYKATLQRWLADIPLDYNANRRFVYQHLLTSTLTVFRGSRMIQFSDSTQSEAVLNRSLKWLLAFVLLVAGLTSADAHHSFAKYDRSGPVTVTGTVVKFEWTNPHAYLELVVDGDEARHYTYECTSINILNRMGWTSRSLRPGDVITATYARVKGGEPGGLLLGLTKADGKVMYTGVPNPESFGYHPEKQ